MRRVAITGMGVVSSIGDNLAEVTQSLREARSGITHSQMFAERGFKCQVEARPKVDVTAVLDRRTRRFMAEGASWNYLAMQEAVEMSGLAPDEVSHPMTGIVMGSGGPSTRDIIEAADKTRDTGSTKKIGPTVVPKAMSSTNSANLATMFKIKGVNYSISSACATSVHCIGAAAEQIMWGKQDVVFAGGGEELHWSMANLFDAMGAMATNFNELRRRRAVPMTRTAMGLSLLAVPALLFWKNGSAPRHAAQISSARLSVMPPILTAMIWFS